MYKDSMIKGKSEMVYYMPFSDNNSFSDDLQQLINNGKGLNLPEGRVAASTYWLMMINISVFLEQLPYAML